MSGPFPPVVALTDLPRQIPVWVRPRPPVNVYDVLGVAGSEGVADLTLAYFLDPAERHELGSLIIDALLSAVDGAPLIGRDGRGELSLRGSDHQGSSAWAVQRQAPASAVSAQSAGLGGSGYIDLLLTNDEQNVAVIIENKIDAELSNPLQTYARHALDADYESVVLVVLAPYSVGLTSEQDRWVSTTITYSTLVTHIHEALNTLPSGSSSSENVSRSLDLLRQFMEVRKDNPVAEDYVGEARFLNEFHAFRVENRRQIDQLLDAVNEANRLTRARSKRLEPLLRDRLARAGLVTGWEAHGQSGRWATCWNAYHFPDPDISVELMMSQAPDLAAPIYVKAYPARTYRHFADVDDVPLGTDWSSTDEEVADAFVARVQQVISTHSGWQTRG